MSRVKWTSSEFCGRPFGFQRRAGFPGRAATKSNRALLFLILLATVLLAAGCTDHLEVTGLPETCKDQSGKEVPPRVERKITQAGNLMAVDTMVANAKGEAEFMMGAVTQSKSLLKPGHRPPNA